MTYNPTMSMTNGTLRLTDMLDLPELPPLPAAVEPAAPQPPARRETLPPRLLTSDEMQSLGPLFAKHGAPLPDESAFTVGCVDAADGHVSAFLTVQARTHAEPMWVEPGSETSVRPLIREVESQIALRIPEGTHVDVFLFAPAGKVARLAELAGMRMEPWVVYSKRVTGVAPDAPATEPISAFPGGQPEEDHESST